LTRHKNVDRSGVPGKPCLLRTVCEASESDVINDGLFGQILLMLLEWVLWVLVPNLMKQIETMNVDYHFTLIPIVKNV